MRAGSKVILVSTLLAVPLTWLSLGAIYMPEPLALLGRIVAFPLLLFEWLGPRDPTRMQSGGVLWSVFIGGQLIWFWILGFLSLGMWRLLMHLRGRR
jgi:hypothetical protein